jgi:serine/threonine protein phosphatase PrpC
MMRTSLTTAFEEIHSLVSHQTEFDCRASGATLTVLVIENETLYCANVGDSKAIMLWDHKRHIQRGINESIPQANITELTTSHNPSIAKEKARIQRNKGDVRPAKGASIAKPGEMPVLRVYHKGKEQPGLAMTRSIGDLDAHTIGVIE